MESTAKPPRFIRFAEYQLDTRTGELRNGAGPVQIHRQPLEVLLLLVKRAGDVVTREELRGALWPDQTFVDFEDNLNHAVGRLRAALGDSPTSPRFIETVPRLGYRLIIPIQEPSPAPPAPQAAAASQREPAPFRWKLRLGIAVLVLGAFAAVILGLNVGGLRRLLQGSGALPALDPKRVAVAVFENRTGDPSLDSLGMMAAESVSQALARIETIRVVPSPAVLAASTERSSQSRDRVQTLAAATSSGLVVTGSYYLQGHALQVRAAITDAIADKPLYPIPPAEGPREKPMEVVETVEQNVLDTLAARYLNPFFDLLVEESHPPRFEAQREFLTGFGLFFAGLPSAADHANRAIDLDPGFVWPHFLMHGFMVNHGNRAGAEAQQVAIARMEGRLTPVARRRLDWCRAYLFGRLEETHSVSRDIVSLLPGSVVDNLQLAWDANVTNRPHEIVEVLRKPLRWELVVRPGAPFGVVVFLTMTGALHQLGQHESELQEARRGRQVYPDLLNLRAYEARALVALGRVRDVNGLVDEILTVPPRWSLPGCCVPGGTPGYVMLSAAEELRAHGYRDASLNMANRAVDWYRSRAGAESSQEDTRAGLGDALYRAERWSESLAVFTSLAAKHSGNISYKSRLGSLAARMHDPASATRIADELRRLGGGDATLQSARILALLPDKDRAVALLREAIAEGLMGAGDLDPYGYGLAFRHVMDLELLRGYPPFEELIKPKE